MPIPLLAPVVKKLAQLDPIEALLASRGYGNTDQYRERGRIETAHERALKAAQMIKLHSYSFAPATKTVIQAGNFAQLAVARDGDQLAATPTTEALAAFNDIPDPMSRNTFVPLSYYVQAASYPQIFSKLSSNGKPLPDDVKQRSRVQSVPMISSLTISPSTAATLRDARNYIDKKIIRGHDPMSTFGLGGSRGLGAGQAASEESEGPLGGREGMMEIRERLEELLAAYEDGEEMAEDDLGTDEEYPDQEDEEWNLDND